MLDYRNLYVDVIPIKDRTTSYSYKIPENAQLVKIYGLDRKTYLTDESTGFYMASAFYESSIVIEADPEYGLYVIGDNDGKALAINSAGDEVLAVYDDYV